MLRLTLLAHAPTVAQRAARFPVDEGIEPLAPSLVRRLAAGVSRVQHIWCGPERYAAETATALGLAATPCPELHAWSAGVWAGQAVLDVAQRDLAAFQAWRTDPAFAPPEGESLQALLVRVAAWTQAQVAHDPARALVIADPAVIRAILLFVLAAPPATFWRLDVAPLSLATVQYAHREWRLRQMGLHPGWDAQEMDPDGA
jgi:broad specificity phosphatase PhoE